MVSEAISWSGSRHFITKNFREREWRQNVSNTNDIYDWVEINNFYIKANLLDKVWLMYLVYCLKVLTSPFKTGVDDFTIYLLKSSL